MVFPIKSCGIFGKEISHGIIKVLARWLKKQVYVIGHQTESEHIKTLIIRYLFQKNEHGHVIVLVYEKLIASGGPLGNVGNKVRSVDLIFRTEVSF
jgi:hypothetical protein